MIIQTYRPEDPVIGFAARQDYRSFFEDEFRRRRTGLYPPFTLLCRLLLESTKEENVERAAAKLERQARALLADHPDWEKKVLLLTNDTPSVKVLRGKTRRHLLLKLLVSREAEELIAALTELSREPQKETEVWFEVNPTTMM